MQTHNTTAKTLLYCNKKSMQTKNLLENRKKQHIYIYIIIFIINKTQLQTPTDCFTPWGDHQGDLIQIILFE